MTQYEIESLWIENDLDVMFQFGDIIRVKSGEHLGKEGKIVALFTLELIEGNTGATLLPVKGEHKLSTRPAPAFVWPISG